MNVLVYPSTHPRAISVSQLLSAILVPHYLPQVIAPDVLAAPESPWHTACSLLVLLAAPQNHTGVRKYLEFGGRILALGVNAKKTRGLFGLHGTVSSFGSVGLGLATDTSILRIIDKNASLYLSFPSQASTSATVNHGAEEVAVSRFASATLDVDAEETHILGRYTDDNALAGVLSESGLVALWSCGPPLSEQLLVPTLSALGLRVHFPPSSDAQSPNLRILPQLLLAHPKKWEIQQAIVHALFPEDDLERVFSALNIEDSDHETPATKNMVFPDEHDTFAFHFARKISTDDPPSGHPLFCLVSSDTSRGEEKVKDVILLARPLTTEQENLYTPLFSPSAFFTALYEFRITGNSDSHTPWGMGDALLYGEVVTSTQTMLDKNPKFLRALPSPLLSFATKQVAGRGRGTNAWLSPAGCMQMSLKLSVSLKSTGSTSSPRSLRASNLVFIQYLYAIAVVEACHALDPTRQWAKKVKLKWPNDIYGEFPAEETWKTTEMKKLGGILVNTSFGGGMVDVIIGAVLATFERIWDSFLATESEGFQPFMDRYTGAWLHSNQTVTLTTTTPHATVRIVGITPDHGTAAHRACGRWSVH
ncbi:hypothetical protein BU15DRAFT_72838 [Melanogaster broomeanus]|nr:hypothetical protein BU15DRAFT_72838 [Melanogaster broomeanus]